MLQSLGRGRMEDLLTAATMQSRPDATSIVAAGAAMAEPQTKNDGAAAVAMTTQGCELEAPAPVAGGQALRESGHLQGPTSGADEATGTTIMQTEPPPPVARNCDHGTQAMAEHPLATGCALPVAGPGGLSSCAPRRQKLVVPSLIKTSRPAHAAGQRTGSSCAWRRWMRLRNKASALTFSHAASRLLPCSTKASCCARPGRRCHQLGHFPQI